MVINVLVIVIHVLEEGFINYVNICALVFYRVAMIIRFIVINPIMNNHHVPNLVITFAIMEKDAQINVENRVLHVWKNVSGNASTINVARNAMKFVITLVAINHVQNY